MRKGLCTEEQICLIKKLQLFRHCKDLEQRMDGLVEIWKIE